MIRLLIEASVLEQDRPTGVGYLTDGLVGALERLRDEELSVEYFWLNFLLRKSTKNPSTKRAEQRGDLQKIWPMPQRVYAKLVYAGIAPPLPLRQADWVLYPNFYLWPSFGRSKKIVFVHDPCFLRHPEYVERKNLDFLRNVAIKSAKKADLVLTDSKFSSDEIHQLMGVPRQKIHALGVPVDAVDFDKSNDRGMGRLKERYGLTKPYILSFGTIEPRKNIECLVEAYCRLPATIREKYSLLLVGKWGWHVEDLRALVDKRQSEGFDIITPGYIDHDDRTTFFRNASFFAITTHYEGFGMPLLEALHCGIPTVAVDIPVLREVGDEACLWAEKTVDGVAGALERVIGDEKLASKLSKLGPKQSKKYSWDKSAKSLIDKIRELS